MFSGKLYGFLLCFLLLNISLKSSKAYVLPWEPDEENEIFDEEIPRDKEEALDDDVRDEAIDDPLEYVLAIDEERKEKGIAEEDVDDEKIGNQIENGVAEEVEDDTNVDEDFEDNAGEDQAEDDNDNDGDDEDEKDEDEEERWRYILNHMSKHFL